MMVRSAAQMLFNHENSKNSSTTCPLPCVSNSQLAAFGLPRALLAPCTGYPTRCASWSMPQHRQRRLSQAAPAVPLTQCGKPSTSSPTAPQQQAQPSTTSPSRCRCAPALTHGFGYVLGGGRCNAHCNPSTHTVTKMFAPCLQAGDITNGSFDFGVGPQQQVAAAITFFILGFLFLLGPCITVYCLVKRQRRRTGGPRNGGNTRFGDRRRLSDSSDGNGYGASGRSGSVVEVGNYSPVTVPRKAGNGAGQPSAIVI